MPRLSSRLGTAVTAPLALLLSAPVALSAQTAPAATPIGAKVRTVTDTLVGGVGGVAVDRLGSIYVADFGERVYKVEPDGRVRIFATGLYGASGNAIDSRGNLIQSNFSGHYVARIDRRGNVEILAEGLAGPVGVAVGPGDTLTVCNCQGNTLSRVTPSGRVTEFLKSDLLNCPNGITRAPNGNFYVVNFSDGRLLEVTPEGKARVLAVLPGGGNGHVTFARGSLYATGFRGHRVFRVSLAGDVTPIAGTGALGEKDGPALEAAFSWPNGIAAGPQGDRLYVNDFLNRFPPTIEAPPVPKSIVRQITLAGLSDHLAAALQQGGVPAMEKRYRAWKSDPATSGIFTEFEINAMGYRLMQTGNLPAATRLFQLNVESYPNSFNVYDSLGEAYMNGGKRQEAIRNYKKSLEMNPANTNAVQMLEKLEG